MGSSLLKVAGVVITQDAHGRYSLNDLHRAAGSEKRHQPSDFLRLTMPQELVRELNSGDPRSLPVEVVTGRNGGTKRLIEKIKSANSQSAPIESIRGGPEQGTYVCRELVYKYARSTSAAWKPQGQGRNPCFGAAPRRG